MQIATNSDASSDTPLWMIYGANGYTGRLIAQEAKREGLTPVLAGRNRSEIEGLGRVLGLRTRVFPCVEGRSMARHLRGISLVLHCAGPFSATSKPMVEACLEARAHYLDITGEIPVFERILKNPQWFRDAGIVALPGAGFDVVPSDCLAAILKRELPSATRLAIALKIHDSPSQGTLKTLVEGLYAGTLVRRDESLVRLPAASLVRGVRFWDDPREKQVVGISWGDVSTAFHSTGIPEIETYLAASPATVRWMKLSRYLAPVLASRRVQRGLKRWVELGVKPPSEKARARAPYYLWGRVENSRGEFRELRIKTPNGYSLTVDSSLQIVRRVLAGEVKPGAWTPSLAFGPDFIQNLKGIEFRRS